MPDTAASDQDTGTAHLARAFETALGFPFTEANALERLRNGDMIFPAMLEAIASAEHSVELLTYIYWRGEIAQRFARTLAEKARQGVPVRLLLDSWGASPMSRELIETMREGGVELRWFRPMARWNLWASTHRTHRKVMIVDGKLGFTGGVGIAEEWCGDARDDTEWRDTHFRIRGPAVRFLRSAFLANWAEALVEDGKARRLPDLACEPAPPAGQPGPALVQVVRSSAGPRWSEVAAMVELAIATTRDALRVGTAYFTPDEATVAQLCEAARRGVRVEFMLPWGHMDQRVSQLAGAEAYAPLLEAGVRLHVFQPTMYHAKIMLLDPPWCVVGSANFNRRSAEQDDEVCLVVHDPGLYAALGADWDADLGRCEPIDLRRWRRRGPWQRAKEAAAQLVRPAV
jgi:cardiolipin synthase